MNCEEELAPRVTADPDDLALIDSNVSWFPGPGGFVGDVPLTEVCPPGIDVTRCLKVLLSPSPLGVGRYAVTRPTPSLGLPG